MIFTLAKDYLIVWPPSVTLTFNLPDQMFKMNNCAKLFWNPSINVKVMARTRSIYDLLSFDLQVWPWPSTYLNKCCKWHFYSSRTTIVPNYFEIHAWMYTFWPGQAQFMTILSFDLQVWPWPSNYLNKCFKRLFYSSKTTIVPYYFEIHAQMYKLWPRQIHTDAHTHKACTYTELKLEQLCFAHHKRAQQKM